MSYLNKKEWKLVGFEKAKRDGKKYDAILENKKNKKIRRMPFGSSSYQQYKDKTGLNLYSHLDHRNNERRKRFHARHRGFIKEGFYSPSWFSLVYLW